MAEDISLQGGWVPAACTLPTIEQPVRLAEFDDFFARDVLRVHRDSPQAIRFELRAEPEVAGRAASLAARETACCSFFAFELGITEGAVVLQVSTAPMHEAVLTALEARALAHIGAGP